MTIILDLLRGLCLFIWIIAAGLGYGWLILPYNDHMRMLTCMFGGGTLMVLTVIIFMSVAIR